MMVMWKILIVIVASAAIVAAVGGLVYLVVLAGLEERARHLHMLANARARRARTQCADPPARGDRPPAGARGSRQSLSPPRARPPRR